MVDDVGATIKMFEVLWWGIIKESSLKQLERGKGEVGKGRNC